MTPFQKSADDQATKTADATRAAATQAAEATRAAAVHAADAGRAAVDKAADAGRKSADKAADVAHTATREAAGLAQHAAKTAQQTVRAGVDTFAQVAERSSRQLNEGMGLSDQSAEQMAEAGQRALRAGADAARHNAETAQQVTQSGLNMFTDVAERSVDQFARTFGFANRDADEVARRSSRNIEAVSESSAVLAQGMQDISREWMGLAKARLQKNLDAFEALMGCRSLQDVMAVHSDLMRDNLELALKNGRQIAQLSVRYTEQAGQKITAAADEQSDRTRRAA